MRVYACFAVVLAVVLGGGQADAQPCDVERLLGDVQREPSRQRSSSQFEVQDFDRDGNPDLVTPIGIHFGRGDGTFHPGEGVHFAPGGFATGDFNGDGHRDIAWGGGFPRGIYSLLGDGARGFGELRFNEIPEGYLPHYMSAADFNSDDLDDLVVVGSGNVEVWLSSGEAGFDFHVSLDANPIGQLGILEVFAGDITADSVPDIAVMEGGVEFGPNDLVVFFGVGNGSFVKLPPYTIDSVRVKTFRFCDLNGDALLDLVTAGRGNVTGHINAGVGNFLLQPSAGGYGGSGITLEVGDFDGDGHTDAMKGNGDDEVLLLRGRGDGSFALWGGMRVPIGVTRCGVGDFDSDGLADMALMELTHIPSPGIQIVRNDRLQWCGGDVWSDLPTRVSSHQIQDFNNDGRDDVVVFLDSDQSELWFYPGQEDGMLGEPIARGTGPYSAGSASGDFDGDGNCDVCLVRPINNRMQIFWGGGDGTFEEVTAIDVTGRPTWIGAGNTDDDRDMEFLVLTDNTDEIVEIDWVGERAVAIRSRQSLGELIRDVYFADVDLDGKIEALVMREFSSQDPGGIVVVDHEDGAFLKGEPFGLVSTTYPNTPSLCIADLNGDSFPDLVYQGSLDIPLRIHLNNGEGGFDAPQGIPADGLRSRFSRGPVYADVTGDGIRDLVSRSAGLPAYDELLVFEGDGLGGFTPAGGSMYLEAGLGFDLGDFNGDGIPEVLAINRYLPDVSGASGDDQRIQISARPLECFDRFPAEDVNRDGAVNAVDLDFVYNRLGKRDAPGLGGDANGDGVIDVNDLSYVLFRIPVLRHVHGGGAVSGGLGDIPMRGGR